MGKSIFISVSLFLVGLSIYVYLGQKRPKTQEIVGSQAARARLIGYDVYRYRNDKPIARSSGKRAAFLDNGRLVCNDQVKMVRFRDNIREEVEAKSAEIVFSSTTLFSSKKNMAETIELRGDVEIIRNNSKVLTDWIHYTDKTSEVFTDRPVRIEQEGQFIAAEQGMTYNMRTESIRMRGGVFGSLQSDVIGEASAKPKKGK
jgi:hypothetical protein